jgi:hypothetical protein
MTIFSEFGAPRSRQPVNADLLNANLLNAKSFALEQLVSIHCVTADLRWAMVELVWRSLTAMCAFAQGRFVLWVRGQRSPRQQGGRGRPCCC